MAPIRKPQAGATLAISVSLILAALCHLAVLDAEAQSSPVKGGPSSSSMATKQRPQRPASSTYSPPVQRPTGAGSGTKSKPASIQQQQVEHSGDYYNEDPLADSEPALYGSVAGAPGVDFPAYTRIPKTSFTCEGKGHDFGFYADPEAQCQVYHVCWSGRHEAFLCGVGTVFNQAILACDYWHSVDCSKSSQFYGVNSELGKAGAEPAANQQRQQQSQRPKQQTQAPPSTSSALASPQQFGEPLKQRPVQDHSNLSPLVYQSSKQQRAPLPAKQQLQQQQVQQQQTHLLNENSFDGFSQQRPIQQPANLESGSKSPPSRPQALSQVQIQVRDSAQPPPPPPVVAATKRARFNPDFNQKVNSLIEAPVRAPLKSTGTSQRPTGKRNPQSANQSPWTARKPARPVAPVQQVPQTITQQQETSQQPQQQQRNYEPELDEPQQQQQSFDDSPVQTSTVQNAYLDRLTPVNKPPKQQVEQQQQQQQVFANDGSSSAITSQFDTLAGDAYGDSSAVAAEDANDDFRSAGAKAAASHNQNWYIMRTV